MAMSVSTATPPVPEPPGAAARPERRFSWGRFDIKVSPYLYIAPFFIVFGIFGAYPMLRTIWMSFHDWDLVNDRTMGHTWVGLENYAKLFTDDYYLNALVNTFGIFFLATVPQLALALFLANLLSRNLKVKTFWRMLIIVPNATSVAAVAIVFGMLFLRDGGVINWLFNLGAFDWRTGRLAQWSAISLMVDWRWTGYNTLILLAGMLAIPRDLYESAAIDGASRWRQFWSITLPMLRPTFLFVTVVSIIGGLQLFTEPFLFNYGRPTAGNVREGQTLALYMWENSMENTQYAGYGAAIAMSIFILIILASVFNFLLIRRTVKQ